MKAARLQAPKQFEVMDVETPVINDGQCLIRLERWSVCGSDIRHAYGPILPEEQYPMKVGAPCHEAAGTIIESRSDKFREGQRVSVLPSRAGPEAVSRAPGTCGRVSDASTGICSPASRAARTTPRAGP